MITITSNQIFAKSNGTFHELGVVGVNNGGSGGFEHDIIFGHSGVKLIEGHLVSDFSGSKVIEVPSDYTIDYTKSFEIGIYFKMSSLVATRGLALCGTGTSNKFYYYPSVELQPASNQIWFGLSSNGSSWATSLTLKNLTLETDTWYFVKVGNDYNGTGKMYIMLTEDFTNYQTSIGVSDAAQQYTAPSGSLFIFGGNALASDLAPANATFDLDNVYIKNDGAILWGRAKYSR